MSFMAIERSFEDNEYIRLFGPFESLAAGVAWLKKVRGELREELNGQRIKNIDDSEFEYIDVGDYYWSIGWVSALDSIEVAKPDDSEDDDEEPCKPEPPQPLPF